ncbi:pentatricopeptide repeat-containing protein At4g21065 [Selaginella moellendorffii]|uniref:pentatricopeptide repeat-containing protein At4g21065 n=1 Tax=Selaginella moellendorffii TaxID=88036 RepID=UPI000D1CB61D|nr:pentatricopeptide repeat-containing protein At4g21065 [Selaginella moellendorffii]|eukprot:XP_024534915.1 pentatricopeptide repeat-containing protein At4g21065 [Selaginella moellendorffii]
MFITVKQQCQILPSHRERGAADRSARAPGSPRRRAAPRGSIRVAQRRGAGLVPPPLWERGRHRRGQAHPLPHRAVWIQEQQIPLQSPGRDVWQVWQSPGGQERLPHHAQEERFLVDYHGSSICPQWALHGCAQSPGDHGSRGDFAQFHHLHRAPGGRGGTVVAGSRSLADACSVFESLTSRSVIAWTALVAAYALNGFFRDALKVFLLMTLDGVEPTEVTFVTVVDVCADIAVFGIGREVHGVIDARSEANVCVGNALINMYGKCASPDEARKVFDAMQRKDIITWNSMIAVYGQNGYGFQALEIYKRMQESRVLPDGVTFTSALDACCCNSSLLARGQAIHDQAIAAGREREATVNSALINMYGKCGRLDLARKVFDETESTNAVSWNTMIMVYAQNSHLREALELFSEMTILGITHDDITFIGVLFACSHAGLVKDSCKLYSSMIGDYGFKPTSLQCGCLIDLLGRAGWLDEAEEFINSMPYHPDHTIWTILLGACITHADVERAARAADRIMALRPTDSGSYVALSNLYALAERWDDMARMRKLMDQRGVFKMAGKSSIEIGGVLHEFIAGDTSHPRKREIYEELRRIEGVIRERGYVPDIKAVLHNAAREAKEKMCCFHSERLAIAFGMISSPGGTELRIMKNLRVCPDCHSATKIISKFSGRKIIVRDANRFHEFRNGSCSCEDYW